ncbi:MAG: hypothetical protein NTV32_00055 [Gammaproteobacteria bacterium]|nr:hypothetical protein [Gammaproteobacteria bacterium]
MSVNLQTLLNYYESVYQKNLLSEACDQLAKRVAILQGLDDDLLSLKDKIVPNPDCMLLVVALLKIAYPTEEAYKNENDPSHEEKVSKIIRLFQKVDNSVEQKISFPSYLVVKEPPTTWAKIKSFVGSVFSSLFSCFKKKEPTRVDLGNPASIVPLAATVPVSQAVSSVPVRHVSSDASTSILSDSTFNMAGSLFNFGFFSGRVAENKSSLTPC